MIHKASAEWRDLEREVKRIVSRIARIDETELAGDLLIREELGIDSLMATEILANCEKTFDIKIDEKMLVEIETLNDFYDLLASLIKPK